MKPLLPMALLLALAGGAALAAKPHEHGAARLDVSVEGQRITIELEAPLDNLLGFERAPRDAAERARVDAMAKALNAADALFRIDPAAGCKLGSVELDSAALKLGDPDPDRVEGHADLDGEFVFDCADAAKAAHVEVGLFAAFPRLQRLDVQVATAKAQFKRTLRRTAPRLALTR